MEEKKENIELNNLPLSKPELIVQKENIELNNLPLSKPELIVQKEKIKPKEITFLEMLGLLSPGKLLRIALDDILRAGDGALIVIDNNNLKNLFEGGFKVNCKLTPQRLAELAKMDGAIIISSVFDKILFANTLLTPDTHIHSDETGTRHKAAERTSVQANTPVIAVSERRGKITLFYKNQKYVLQNSEDLLRRATETLHILEKQKEIYDDLLTNLNVLEITNLVSVGDVCSVLQRIEIIGRMMDTMNRYLIELGKEGMILKARIRELFRRREELGIQVLKDYSRKPFNAKKFLAGMNFDNLLNLDSLASFLFEKDLGEQISSKGNRMLRKINLTERELNMLVSKFKNLDSILKAGDEELAVVLKQKTSNFKKELENLKEQIMLGKKI